MACVALEREGSKPCSSVVLGYTFLHLKSLGAPLFLLPILQRETTFEDFLFASMDDEPFQKMAILKGKISLQEAELFFLKIYPKVLKYWET